LGVACLKKDVPRPRRAPSITPATATEVIAETTQSKAETATGLSRSTMAREVCNSKSNIGGLCRAHGLKAHRVGIFKIINNPDFAEKLEDFADLYLKPLEHALVQSAPEKSLIQALDSTQPGLAMKKGRA
jgi:hypothetical protein